MRLDVFFLTFLSCLGLIRAGGENNQAAITAAEIQEMVDRLAGEEMAGRGAGSPGGHLAGEYLAEQMEEIGLEPAGVDGSWFQPFGDGMRNVLGLLRGSAPELCAEYVVVSAHYDHLGDGRRGGSLSFFRRDATYYGADDNASGTAGLLELAEALVASGSRRSVLFLLCDGEERGLLGSRYYVQNPLFPLEATVADCNLDMIGRLDGRKIVVYGAGSGSGFSEQIAESAEAAGDDIRVLQGITANSDHFAFYSASIPSVHFFSGLHGDYHRPGDTADKLDAKGAETIAQLALQLVRSVADRDDRPRFSKVGMEPFGVSDFLSALGFEFDDLDKALKSFLKNKPPKLGVRVDPKSLLVDSVIDGSVAERAEVQSGDIITAIDGEALDSLSDLHRALRGLSGKHIMSVERDGEALDLPLDFGSKDGRGDRWF